MRVGVLCANFCDARLGGVGDVVYLNVRTIVLDLEESERRSTMVCYASVFNGRVLLEGTTYWKVIIKMSFSFLFA